MLDVIEHNVDESELAAIGRLQRVINDTLGVISSHRAEVILLYTERHTTASMPGVRESRRRFQAFFEGLVADAIAEGSIPTMDPQMVANLVLGMVNSTVFWRTERSSTEIADALWQLLFAGHASQLEREQIT